MGVFGYVLVVVVIPGACHCGKVKFAAEMDLSGGIVRCNCSHCAIKVCLRRLLCLCNRV